MVLFRHHCLVTVSSVFVFLVMSLEKALARGLFLWEGCTSRDRSLLAQGDKREYERVEWYFGNGV
jgi:hypothetical protein